MVQSKAEQFYENALVVYEEFLNVSKNYQYKSII